MPTIDLQKSNNLQMLMSKQWAEQALASKLSEQIMTAKEQILYISEKQLVWIDLHSANLREYLEVNPSVLNNLDNGDTIATIQDYLNKKLDENSTKKEVISGPEWYSLLDVVKIDGRWAQISGAYVAKGDHEPQAVCYLDSGEYAYIDFAKYDIAKIIDRDNYTLLNSGEITPAEFKNVRWDGDNIGTPLALNVRVFGEFRKK